jgi:hypothetical protein
VLFGLNCTLRDTDWPGLSVTGNAEPETVNPDPVIAAEFTVTADVPVDFKVTDWVADEFKATLPKATLVALMLSAAWVELNCRAKVLFTPPADAARVTD